MILGLDISHFQQGANLAAAKSAGRDFVVVKATESTSYTDPQFATYRAQAHAAGMVVGFYHFARAGNAAAEAAYFLKAIGTLQPGEFLVLDWEVPAPAGGAPAWCKTWLDAVHAATGVAPFIYMNQSAVRGSDWSAVAPTYALWLAAYDNAAATQTAVPYWAAPAMKQYSDAGSVLGVAGTCDVDAFYGTRDQLLAYGFQGSTTVASLTAADLQAIHDAVWHGQGDTGQGKGVWIADRIIGIDAKTGDTGAKVDTLLTIATQARDAATGANQRAGDALAAINTAVVPKLGQAVDPQAVAAPIVAAVERAIAALPPAQAQAVASQVVSLLGQHLSAPPA